MTNVEKLKNRGNALEAIRQRLGIDKNDTSLDDQINNMSPKEIASEWSAWYLGDGEWGKTIIEIYEHLKEEK